MSYNLKLLCFAFFLFSLVPVACWAAQESYGSTKPKSYGSTEVESYSDDETKSYGSISNGSNDFDYFPKPFNSQLKEQFNRGCNCSFTGVICYKKTFIGSGAFEKQKAYDFAIDNREKLCKRLISRLSKESSENTSIYAEFRLGNRQIEEGSRAIINAADLAREEEKIAKERAEFELRRKKAEEKMLAYERFQKTMEKDKLRRKCACLNDTKFGQCMSGMEVETWHDSCKKSKAQGLICSCP